MSIAALVAACSSFAFLQQRCTTADAHSVNASPGCYCGGQVMTFNTSLPTFNITNQQQADCFAWQEFIALNQSLDTSRPFGDTSDLGMVQWEAYMPTYKIFRNGAKPPVPWNGLGDVPIGASLKKFKTGRYLVLGDNQKIPKGFTSNQVVENNGPAWLGAQNATNIWYQVLVNKVEYDYIVQNKFYNADSQYNAARAGRQIFLPSTGDGSIEVKAAWMELSAADQQYPRFSVFKQRYKLANAYVQDSANGRYRETIVALIGLHILRKVPGQPLFVWATFEQVDNNQGVDDTISHPLGFNLFSTKCTSNTVTVKTRAGKDTTVTVGCNANQQPPYFLVNGNRPVPIQVKRETPIGLSELQTSGRVIACIAQVNPNSVWRYYRLVNTIWSSNPTADSSQNKTDSMILTGMLPSIVSSVANTTLETYNQQTNCINSCHKFASTARPSFDSGKKRSTPRYLSDFSFVFGLAKTPPALKN
jgi:hypothetical protein